MSTARVRPSSTASLAVLAVGLGLLTTTTLTTPAQAAGCQASEIAVVVSFNELGGGTQTACIEDVDSGFAALDAAGYDVTPVAAQPFVCRINDVPATDPCQRIPPASAYWAYWTAPMGGIWTYATRGAGSSDPEPGGVEGWSFGADAEPEIAPPESTEPESESAEPAGPTESTESPDAATADAGAAESAGASGGETQRSASNSAGGGTPWAVLATIAGVAVLGVAAYGQSRRRRPQPPAPGT